MTVHYEFRLTKSSTVPAGQSKEYPSLKDYTIDALIALFNEKGIQVDCSLSQKTIEYDIPYTKKKSSVPLRSSFEVEVRVCGYTLHTNQGLDVILSDYFDPSGGNGSGHLGGRVSIEQDISCKLNYYGPFGNEKSIMAAAGNIVKDYHTSLEASLSPQK